MTSAGATTDTLCLDQVGSFLPSWGVHTLGTTGVSTTGLRMDSGLWWVIFRGIQGRGVCSGLGAIRKRLGVFDHKADNGKKGWGAWDAELRSSGQWESLGASG